MIIESNNQPVSTGEEMTARQWVRLAVPVAFFAWVGWALLQGGRRGRRSPGLGQCAKTFDVF